MALGGRGIAWLIEGTVAADGAEAADPDRRRQQMGVAFVFSRIQGSNA
jgi:hypothetical protein